MSKRHKAKILGERGFDLVGQAFVLAIASRSFGAGAEDHSIRTIRTLRYSLAVIQEFIEEPPDPGYPQHLRHRIRVAGLDLDQDAPDCRSSCPTRRARRVPTVI
jgi:hypothetical protein